jgi:hypothetical protein
MEDVLILVFAIILFITAKLLFVGAIYGAIWLYVEVFA